MSGVGIPNQNNQLGCKYKLSVSGNATIGIGHLIHLGAIGSTQYDPNALSAEEPFKNGLTLDEVFWAFTDVDIKQFAIKNRVTRSQCLAGLGRAERSTGARLGWERWE